jgi:hypothetical protein
VVDIQNNHFAIIPVKDAPIGVVTLLLIGANSESGPVPAWRLKIVREIVYQVLTAGG